MKVLEPREGYRLWAPTYEAENAITQLEQRLVAELGPAPAGLRLLDVGCGTARRLIDTKAIQAVGVDLSHEMLVQARSKELPARTTLLEGDLRALPLPGGSFDLVWCRLVVGHLAELDAAFGELGRMVAVGGHVIVTDFHPAAYTLGHRRTFQHCGEVFEVRHHLHSQQEQIEAATRVGLTLRARSEAMIGPEVRHFYEDAGKAALYLDHYGLPVVSALAFTRDG